MPYFHKLSVQDTVGGRLQQRVCAEVCGVAWRISPPVSSKAQPLSSKTIEERCLLGVPDLR